VDGGYHRKGMIRADRERSEYYYYDGFVPRAERASAADVLLILMGERVRMED
jgi:hypothetical protein